MSNPAAKYSSDEYSDPEDGCTTKPSSGKPTGSKLAGKWKIPKKPKAATAPAASTVNPSGNDQKYPTKADGGESKIDSETKRDAREPPRKLPPGVAVAFADDSQEITSSMCHRCSKGPLEGEALRDRLRVVERLDRMM